MYWTDTARDVIEKATMDGNSRTILINSGLSSAIGLTLDIQSQILYWSDYTNNRIERSDVNGQNRRVIVTGLRDPWALTFSGGILYWTDTYHDRIYSYSVTSSSASVLQVTGYLGNSPYGLRVIDKDLQPLGSKHHSFTIINYQNLAYSKRKISS